MPIDRREDAGDFYPGGKVVSTRPVATGGDVRRAEFADVRVETNTMPALRSAVRSLAARLGATVVSAFAVCAAFAATVQTVPVNDLDFDANPSVVTNVTFEGLAQEGEVESIRVAIASNRVEIASNRVEIASNADSISTLSNSIPTTTSNIVTKAYVEDLGISADFSTNNTELVETIEATAPAPGNYAAVSNAAMNAVQLVGIHAVSLISVAGTRIDPIPCQRVNWNNAIFFVAEYDGVVYRTIADNGRWYMGDDESIIEGSVSGWDIGSNDIEITFSKSDNTQICSYHGQRSMVARLGDIPEWAKQPTKPTYTASEVGATTPADVTAAIREQSLGGIWDAELEVWWTPRMKNGSLTYEATTNVNLSAEN